MSDENFINGGSNGAEPLDILAFSRRRRAEKLEQEALDSPDYDPRGWDDIPPPTEGDGPGYTNGKGRGNWKGAANGKDQAQGLSLRWFEGTETVTNGRDFVERLLAEQSSIVVWGKSNCGKTFWVADLMLTIASATQWRDRRVEQGGVLYCALEGGIGFQNRIAGWKQESGIDGPLPFAFTNSPMNLFRSDADVMSLIATIREAGETMRDEMGFDPKIVVIDTLARAMPGGSDNKPEDMGALIANMDRVRAETGCAVMFIHHCGKDESRGSRGHTSLPAAIDTEIEVQADENGNRRATVIKQRDGETGGVFEFRLRQIVLGENKYGEPVTTCVVEHLNIGTSAEPRRKKARPERLPAGPANLLRALQNVLNVDSNRTVLPDTRGFPDALTVGTTEEAWRREYARTRASEKPDTVSKAFRRAAEQLEANGRVRMLDGFVWLPDNVGVTAPSPNRTDTDT